MEVYDIHDACSKYNVIPPPDRNVDSASSVGRTKVDVLNDLCLKLKQKQLGLRQDVKAINEQVSYLHFFFIFFMKYSFIGCCIHITYATHKPCGPFFGLF